MVMTKWGGRPHWEFDAVHLGVDSHGTWLGVPAGTPMVRPGMSFTTTNDHVCLVPVPDAGGGGGWVASMYGPGHDVATYVDMTSVPEWSADGTRLDAIDLDLDVIRLEEGFVFVDDEDEFAVHQVEFDYPSEVVSLAEESCGFVLGSVLDERAPFDGDTSERWLRDLAGLAGQAHLADQADLAALADLAGRRRRPRP